MNQGLEILIARTKTHPQEFIGWEISGYATSKWLNMMENFAKHMTEEEKFAWEEAKESLSEWHDNKRRDDFTEAVMKELLVRDGEDEIEPAPRPKKLVTAASMTHEALTILAGGGIAAMGSGGGGYPQGGGYGGGGSSYAGSGGSVVVKTPTGTHTFTKNGVVTVVQGDEQVTWLPKP